MARDKKTRDRLFQEQGAIRERWISNTERLVFCPASKSDFTFENLDENYWDINSHPDGLPNGIKLSDMQAVNIPEQAYTKIIANLYNDVGQTLAFSGRAGKKVLFIEDIARFGSSDDVGPWISEVSKAAYQHCFPLFSLRHIFMVNVSEQETKEFVVERLNLGTEPKIFESGTPEFQQILGTRIGKTVAYIILNSFDAGTRKIPKIAIWLTGCPARFIQARFDIEVTSQSP